MLPEGEFYAPPPPKTLVLRIWRLFRCVQMPLTNLNNWFIPYVRSVLKTPCSRVISREQFQASKSGYISMVCLLYVIYSFLYMCILYSLSYSNMSYLSNGSIILRGRLVLSWKVSKKKTMKYTLIMKKTD